MNWAVLQPAIRAAVQASTGLVMNGGVEWDGSSAATALRPPVVANLSTGSVLAVGQDEEREATAAPDRTVMISGQREIHVTVKIETQNQADDAIALVYADRLRVRIQRQSVVDALASAGLALADVSATTKVNVTRQGRVLSVYITELTLNAAENDVDDTPGAGDWIEKVTGQSHFTNPDGTESSAQADIEVP